METISLTSAIVDCHMTQHNWIQFQAEGHSITYRDPQSGSYPFKANCPACTGKRLHSPEELQFHAQDQIFCLNLFTPGTNPDDWKNTGIQCIRVMAPTREEVIRLMQQAIVDTVIAFGRQEYSKQFQQSQLEQLKLVQDQIHLFVTDNISVPQGQSPVDVAMRIVRDHIKQTTGKTELRSDNNELIPQSWRRD